jgi:hypothetical protein
MVTAKKIAPRKGPSKPVGSIQGSTSQPGRNASLVVVLTQRMVEAAEHQAALAGWAFAPDCMNHHLRPFLEQGSVNLTAANRGGDLASVVGMEAATRYLVSLMIEEATRLGLARLQEDSFINTRMVFCPCFPFC